MTDANDISQKTRPADEEEIQEAVEESSPAEGDDAEGSEQQEASDRQEGEESREEEAGSEQSGQRRVYGPARVGAVLADRYELTDFLGSGAMGDVYRGEHVLMRKTVAVKVLNSEVTGQGKIVERFRREAQAAANLDHANVCVATDFGRTERGDFFLIMEYLEGETLKEMIADHGGVSRRRALHIVDQICSALIRAHEVGVVHRDLKPDNIMLVERGKDEEFVKILDFGIARVRMTDEMPELTKTGAVFGTPSYMSPEQAAGDPVDHRTDLYAVGSLLFELLCGRRVFEADRGAKVMAMHVSNEPPRPTEHAPEGVINEPLEALILELLEKEPDDRPQTAREVRRRLHEIEPGLVAQVEPGIPLEGLDGPTATLPAHREPEPRRDPDTTIQVDESADPVPEDDPSRIVTDTLDGMSDWFRRNGSSSRWAALGLLGLVAAMATTLLAVVFTGRGVQGEAVRQERVVDTLAVQRQRWIREASLDSAMKSMRTGATRRAIAELSDHPARNPHRAFLLGRAYADIEQWKRSVEQMKATLTLQPSYIQEEALVEGLVGALATVGGEAVDEAQKLLARRLDRPTVRQVLGRTAWRHGSTRARRRARQVLEENDVLSDLPEWTRYSIALRHSRGCEAHAKQIDRLVELGDPRGLEILHVYDGFRRTGCGRFEKEDCFGCIRDDIAGALEALGDGG
jgi:serine/threonine-protein kinase